MSSFLSVSEDDSIEANQVGQRTNMYGSIVADDEGNMSLDEVGEDGAEVCAVIFAHFAFKFPSDIFYITFCMKVTTVDASINRVKCACKGQRAKRKRRGTCKCREGNKKCHEPCSSLERITYRHMEPLWAQKWQLLLPIFTWRPSKQKT